MHVIESGTIAPLALDGGAWLFHFLRSLLNNLWIREKAMSATNAISRLFEGVLLLVCTVFLATLDGKVVSVQSPTQMPFEEAKRWN